MVFIELKPRIYGSRNTEYLGDKIQIRFNCKDPHAPKMFMYIGVDIVKKVGIKAKDKVKLFIDDEDDCLWWIVKSDFVTGDDSKKDRMVTACHRRVKYEMTWKDQEGNILKIPERFKNGQSLFASWVQFNGGIKIALPGVQKDTLNFYNK